MAKNKLTGDKLTALVATKAVEAERLVQILTSTSPKKPRKGRPIKIDKLGTELATEKRVTTIVDKRQWSKLQVIAQRSQTTTKEVLNAIIRLYIEAYEQARGSIEVEALIGGEDFLHTTPKQVERAEPQPMADADAEGNRLYDPAKVEQIMQTIKTNKEKYETTMVKTILGKNYYDLQAVADMLQVSVATIRNHMREGYLKGVRVGSRTYCTEDDIRAYLETPRSKE